MDSPTPEQLQAFYSHFRVSERVLLTGHSHQAWPDVGLEAQRQAWLDAAEYIDDKWAHAFAKANEVKKGFARLLGIRDSSEIVLGSSTHDLLVKFLSALPLTKKRRIVTTDGEFHSLRRQLSRLEEEGIEILRVPVEPIATLSERVARELSNTTAAVMLSAVMFKDAGIVPNLGSLADACRDHGVPLFIDAYHALNVIPFDLLEQGLRDAYIVGGGYKYCQLGEGNCFLRVPEDCDFRPVVTGWYAEFEELESGAANLAYPRGAARFSGSTYDSTSHYRGAAVFHFFEQHGLAADLLRETSQRQIGLLASAFDALDIDPAIIARPDRDLPSIGGFLALTTPHAATLQQKLKTAGVHTDQRDGYLRLGPAPYVTDDQLRKAIDALDSAAQTIAR